MSTKLINTPTTPTTVKVATRNISASSDKTPDTHCCFCGEKSRHSEKKRTCTVCTIEVLPCTSEKCRWEREEKVIQCIGCSKVMCFDQCPVSCLSCCNQYCDKCFGDEEVTCRSCIQECDDEDYWSAEEKRVEASRAKDPLFKPFDYSLLCNNNNKRHIETADQDDDEVFCLKTRKLEKEEN